MMAAQRGAWKRRGAAAGGEKKAKEARVARGGKRACPTARLGTRLRAQGTRLGVGRASSGAAAAKPRYGARSAAPASAAGREQGATAAASGATTPRCGSWAAKAAIVADICAMAHAQRQRVR